jgi:hypothetical protein
MDKPNKEGAEFEVYCNSSFQVITFTHSKAAILWSAVQIKLLSQSLTTLYTVSIHMGQSKQRKMFGSMCRQKDHETVY